MTVKQRILFIDDNKATNVYNEAIINFSDISLDPTAFTSAKEAMEFLDTCHSSGDGFPDFIFLDLNIPPIHGFDFVKEYEQKFMKSYKDTKLYIMSTTKHREDELKAMEFPTVYGFYEKPFSKEIADQVMDPETNP